MRGRSYRRLRAACARKYALLQARSRPARLASATRSAFFDAAIFRILRMDFEKVFGMPNVVIGTRGLRTDIVLCQGMRPVVRISGKRPA